MESEAIMTPMTSKKYRLGQESFDEVVNIASIASGDVPYQPSSLASIPLTYTTTPDDAKIDILHVYDMIRGGKAGFSRYSDKFSCLLYDWTGALGRDDKHNKAELFKCIAPSNLEGLVVDASAKDKKTPPFLDTVAKYLPEDGSVTPLDHIYSLIGSRSTFSAEMNVSREMLRETALAFIGISPRLAHHGHDTRLDYWRTSSMSKTVTNVLTQVCVPLLSEMVTIADANGLFDMMQQGSRWMTDHAFYTLWARNSFNGTTDFGKYSFFLVGVLGFQFTAFGSLFGLSTRLGMTVTEILVRIALQQSLNMLRAIRRRKAEIEDVTYPWYLLAHSLSSGFTHEFSLAVFPIISYIAIYATGLLDGESDPNVNIGGLTKFTERDKEEMKAIARRLVNIRSQAMFQPLEAEVQGEIVAKPRTQTRPSAPQLPSSDDADIDEGNRLLGFD